MPERFGFICFLFDPKFQSPAIAVSSAAAAFPDCIGIPIEVMVLDASSNRQVVRPWQSDEVLLHQTLGPTELLFVYYENLKNRDDRVCIHFEQSKAFAAVTVSLPDMAIANQHNAIAAACCRLYSLCLVISTGCVVAAGGEIDFGTTNGTMADVVAAMLAPASVAKWIVSDVNSLPSDTPGSELMCRLENVVVLQRL